MKWLSFFRRRPKADPLAELRREPTPEEHMQFRREKFRLDRLDALRMVCERRLGSEGRVYHYRITQKGRERLAELERDCGVHP